MNTLLIIASTIGRDGTSRFITYLANNLTLRNNVKVKLLFFRSVTDESRRLLDNNVDIKCLNIRGSLLGSFYIIIKHIIKINPTFCLIGFHQLLWISFLRPLFHLVGIKLLIRDTIIPSLYHENDKKWQKCLNKWAYHLYDSIIVQSMDMQNDIVNYCGCKKSKIILINNPVDVDKINLSVGECPEELKNNNLFTFIAAGRLAKQKGYDIIINRMAELRQPLPFRLIILGSGELEKTLQIMTKEKKLNKYVSFIGFKPNVSDYLYYSDGLLLSSRYEGFPNIVLEAQALGKPVFTNNCKGGINEIIVNKVNGIVCDFNNNDSFSDGLELFFSIKFNTCEIKKMTQDRYGLTTIIDKYERIFIL